MYPYVIVIDSMFGLMNVGSHAIASDTAARVEPGEARRERGADLHELEARLHLLDQHVDLDRPDVEPEVPLQGRQDVVPERGFLGRLDLRQIEDDRTPRAEQPLVVVRHVEAGIDDRSREPGAVGVADMPVVEVLSARPEDHGREVELLLPVRNDLPAEEPLGPRVHLRRDAFGRAQEDAVSGERELQVPLVVERHGVRLPERVLAVEHPAVGTREERVGHVPDRALDRHAGLGGRTRALDPLPLEVVGDLAAGEPAGSRVGDLHARARDGGRRVEESDARFVAEARASSLDAGALDLLHLAVEGGQRPNGGQRPGRVHVVVGRFQAGADLDGIVLG
jgi:hypothetical protein